MNIPQFDCFPVHQVNQPPRGGYNDLNDVSIDAAVDRVAAMLGLTLSTTSRNALVAAQQAERSAQTWKSYWSPTNLLTMAMLTPEFHMA